MPDQLPFFTMHPVQIEGDRQNQESRSNNPILQHKHLCYGNCNKSSIHGMPHPFKYTRSYQLMILFNLQTRRPIFSQIRMSPEKQPYSETIVPVSYTHLTLPT